MCEKVIAVTLSVGLSVCLSIHLTGFRMWLTLTFDEGADLSTRDDPLRLHEQNISFITGGRRSNAASFHNSISDI